VEEPAVERAVEQVERELDVGAGRQLAALDRACNDRAGLVAARFDEAFPVLLGEH
jgi:hypothetical protein